MRSDVTQHPMKDWKRWFRHPMKDWERWFRWFTRVFFAVWIVGVLVLGTFFLVQSFFTGSISEFLFNLVVLSAMLVGGVLVVWLQERR